MLSGSKRTTLNLDAELVNKAQEYGLNLSQWVNSRLRGFLNGGLTLQAPTNSERKITTELIVRMSDGFKNWLIANRNDKNYIKSLEMYLTKYFNGLVLSSPQNIIEYTSKMRTTSKYPILALRLYIKYLEETRQLS
ncbi:MAG TPA: type II toxin-antitoxin system CcdA family antitoxin, partial [Thermoplasmataceae archaeon]|nr:type II toxin-antitoxin system CcdA family antitoxin [Thermoplasmataceae archaeon]